LNFKNKAYLQKLFSNLPNGEKVNYFFQKHVTHSLPITDNEFIKKLATVKNHFDNFILYGKNKNVNECSYFEFGTGYDVVIPIGIRLLGFYKLICIDIRELVSPELINDTIKRLKKFKGKTEFNLELPEDIPQINKENYQEILKKYFKIDDFAPLDVRKTNLESSSIDFILSNATPEHIPQIHIKNILIECHRILKAGGIMSNAIDYRDHWSFFDNNISIYNYLQYSEKKWKRYNHSIMYQNRMRHKEYLEIIKEVGFEVVKEKTNYSDDKEFNKLKRIKFKPTFQKQFFLGRT